MVKFRPKVILSAAITLDGKIATKTGDSKLSSIKDKKRLHKLRSKVDAILVGKNTVQHDNPVLNVRYVKGKDPVRIILDSSGTISSKSKIIQTCSKIPTIIVVSKKISKKNLNRLEKFPLDIIVSGQKSINVSNLLNKLAKRKIRTLLLEGGGTVNWEFVRHGFVDEVIITLEPYLVGGIDAISLVQGIGFSTIAKSLKLRLKNSSRLGNELVLYYYKP